jgi:hypothetical protein
LQHVRCQTHSCNCGRVYLVLSTTVILLKTSFVLCGDHCAHGVFTVQLLGVVGRLTVNILLLVHQHRLSLFCDRRLVTSKFSPMNM